MKFVDEVKISVCSGKGGPGCISFRRESMYPRGGPDGGDGGKGGDVIIKVDAQQSTLVEFLHQKKFAAQEGQAGGGSNCTGSDGLDLILKVPKGTIIKDEQGQALYDLANNDSEVVLLKGGRGGKGNTFFKNSVNQAPEYAQPGEPGECLNIRLELKLIADVGIIGFPNAGKSTLISRISAAKPKVADYPFTTLTPNLGVVRMGDRSFVIADIPGLVPGAHKGVGLGIKFLKHIERTKVFVHLIDISHWSNRDPLEDYHAIMLELSEYDRVSGVHAIDYVPLAKRPQIVVLNKADVLSEEQIHEIVSKFAAAGIKTLTLSAVAGYNVKELIYKIGGQLFDELNK